MLNINGENGLVGRWPGMFLFMFQLALKPKPNW